jgi:hypothetical protein
MMNRMAADGMGWTVGTGVDGFSGRETGFLTFACIADGTGTGSSKFNDSFRNIRRLVHWVNLKSWRKKHLEF